MSVTHLAGGPRSSSHGDIEDREIDALGHAIYMALAGRAGGQDLIGGTGASDEMTLQGSTNITLGGIRIKSKLILENVQSNADPVDEQGAMIEFAETFSTTDPVVISILRNNSVWNADPGTFLGVNEPFPGGRLLDDSSTVNINDDVGLFSLFAAVNYAATFIVTDNSHHIPPGFGVRYAPALRGATGGLPPPTARLLGVTLAPYIQAAGAFSEYEVTKMVGVEIAPTWSSPTNSTVDFGDVIGTDYVGPKLGFVGGNGGDKRVNEAVGIRMHAPDPLLIVDDSWTAVLSQAGPDAKHFVVRNQGGAKSTFGTGDIFFGTFDAEEFELTWDPATDVLALQSTGADPTVGLHLNADRIGFGDTVPDPATVNAWWTAAAPDIVAVAGGDVNIFDFVGGEVADGGNALGNITTFNLLPPDYQSGGGSVTDLTNLTITTMSQETGGIGNQGFWLRLGTRSRHEGVVNEGNVVVNEITGDVFNYPLPTNFNSRPIIVITSDAARSIQGIDGDTPEVQDGDYVTFLNNGSFPITFTHEDVAEIDPTQRINSYTGADYIMGPGERVRLYRGAFGGTDRWYIRERFLRDNELEDIDAWTLMLRNTGSTGSRADVKVSALTDEPSPAAGDFLLIELADGTLASTDIGALPGSGINVATDSIWNVLGDLAVGTGSNTAARLSIGDTDQLLISAGATAAWGEAVHASMQDIGAWTILLRNAGSSGVRADVKISALTEEVSPSAGDWLLGEADTGELIRIDVGNISGGGGDVATDAIWNLKGDLAVGTGSNTATRLGVGANVLPLVADSAEATGLKWVRLAYAGMQTVSADQRILGRDGGGGDIEEIAPAAARTLLELDVGTDFQKSLSKTFNLENPTASEDKDFFRTDIAITITEVRGVLNEGTGGPSVTCTIRHATARNGAGNTAVNAQAVTSITSGSVLTLDDATVPAGSFIWVETTAKNGTVPDLSLTLIYTED